MRRDVKKGIFIHKESCPLLCPDITEPHCMAVILFQHWNNQRVPRTRLESHHSLCTVVLPLDFLLSFCLCLFAKRILYYLTLNHVSVRKQIEERMYVSQTMAVLTHYMFVQQIDYNSITV